MIKNKKLAFVPVVCSVCVLTMGGVGQQEVWAVSAASEFNVFEEDTENQDKEILNMEKLPVSIAKKVGEVCRIRCQDKHEEVAEELKRQEEERAAEEARKIKEAQEAQVSQAASAQIQASADIQSLMASIIYCEAGNQSYEGQVAVGAVIMNRVRSDQFPDTVEAVIYQSGQFGPVSTGWLDQVRSSGGYTESAMQAAADALAGVNPIGGCLYFDQGGYGMQIGAHYFH